MPLHGTGLEDHPETVTVQNAAALAVLDTLWFIQVIPLLCNLYWHAVAFQLQFKVLIIIFTVLMAQGYGRLLK